MDHSARLNLKSGIFPRINLVSPYTIYTLSAFTRVILIAAPKHDVASRGAGSERINRSFAIAIVFATSESLDSGVRLLVPPSHRRGHRPWSLHRSPSSGGTVCFSWSTATSVAVRVHACRIIHLDYRVHTVSVTNHTFTAPAARE